MPTHTNITYIYIVYITSDAHTLSFVGPLQNNTQCSRVEAVSFLFSVLIPKEKPPITVVGDVGGRIAIIVVRDASLT